jgi:hypothetical protein
VKVFNVVNSFFIYDKALRVKVISLPKKKEKSIEKREFMYVLERDRDRGIMVQSSSTVKVN